MINKTIKVFAFLYIYREFNKNLSNKYSSIKYNNILKRNEQHFFVELLHP